MKPISLVLGALLLGLTSTGFSAPTQPLDFIVAVVDNHAITGQEFLRKFRVIRDRLRQQQRALPDAQRLREMVLERLIADRLQLNLANQLGIRVDDTTLNGALRNVAQQNGLSVSQFRRALEREGHGFDQFRDNLREELTISQMRKRRINSRIQIDDGEVEDYLRRHAAEFYPNVEYRLSHVLLPLEAESAAAQMQQAQQLIESARAQQSSAPLSAAASDPSIRATDLGWRGLANLPTLFTRIAPQLAVGEVSDPIRADNGIHIIKLLETRGQEPMMVEQYLTRHILLQPNDLLSDEQAQAQLKQLRQRIQQGEAFAPLAQAHSQDKGSASQGGMLPWAGPGDMVPAYEQQMRATPVGGLSQPFRSRFGWHLLEVLEKRRHDATDTILRKRAREALFMERVEEETEAWLNQLRDEAFVEIRSANLERLDQLR